jgi:FKBP-type peptidyl-prolyl cis-trans isomerase SlyD
MNIARHSVVTIDYTLTSPEGEVLDSSKGGDPLSYLHGVGMLIPGLEKRLEGMAAGQGFDVKIAPHEGYGLRDERLVHKVTKKQLPAGLEVDIGLELSARGPEGELVMTVVAVEGEQITLDGNHPLAGIELHFVGEVKAVRAATQEELSHGHVHGAGGHHH